MNINNLRPLTGSGRKLYIETYGCQMNVGDSEIVVSIMQEEGFRYTEKLEEADIVLINTCSIRDNAEQRIWGRLSEMRHMRKKKPSLIIGIIGFAGCGVNYPIYKKLLEKVPKDLPIFFVSGEDDPVGSFGKEVVYSVETLKEVGVKNIDLKLYPNDRHEILNDASHDRVVADILDFLS